MCRWVAYAGPKIFLEDLIFHQEHSIVQQSLADQGYPNAYRPLSTPERRAGGCVPRGTPRLHTAPPCPLRGRGKAGLPLRGRHMPPSRSGWTPLSIDYPCLAPAYGPGAGFHPQASAQARLCSPCAYPSARGRGRRLDCGSGLAHSTRLCRW